MGLLTWALTRCLRSSLNRHRHTAQPAVLPGQLQEAAAAARRQRGRCHPQTAQVHRWRRRGERWHTAAQCELNSACTPFSNTAGAVEWCGSSVSRPYRNSHTAMLLQTSVSRWQRCRALSVPSNATGLSRQVALEGDDVLDERERVAALLKC